jgi:hypothetical protein
MFEFIMEEYMSKGWERCQSLDWNLSPRDGGDYGNWLLITSRASIVVEVCMVE